MTLVKICGVSTVQQARAAAAFGADFVGIVFAPSRRQVTLGEAKRIAAGLRKNGPPPRKTQHAEELLDVLAEGRPLLAGVFADQGPETINAIADEVGLDLVQLSGSEPWEMCNQLNRTILKCMKVRDGETAENVLLHVREGAIVLLDPYVAGTYGGTGKTLDWNVAAGIARQMPTVLAGGLTPNNVAAAVRAVHPWAVDVSSGVETGGVKDAEKIRAFLAAVREADNNR
jgi:phosphoribosylanthranilate isomerase